MRHSHSVTIAAITVLLFLSLPLFVLLIVSINENGFVLPPSGLTLRWYIEAIFYDQFIRAFLVSFLIAISSSTISALIGIPMALVLVRSNFRGKGIINTIIMLPVMLPVVFVGLSLFILFAVSGIGNGLFGLVVGHTVLVFPLMVRAVTANLEGFDGRYEEAAYSAGASPLKTILRITLPILRTGILGALVLCFLVSWNNFPLSLFLATSGWSPLPVELYGYVMFQFSPTVVALSMTLVIFSLLMLVILHVVVGLGVVVGARGHTS